MRMTMRIPMRKEYLSLIFVLLTVVSLFGCGADISEKLGMAEPVAAVFENCLTVKQVLDDIGNVDFYHTAKTGGLEIKEDSVNNTVTYSDAGGKTVYTFFSGEENPHFDYFTKSASGREITVGYFNRNDTRYAVEIEGDDYSVSLSGLNKNKTYGADKIAVKINKQNDGKLDEYMICEYANREWYTSSAYFNDEEGYKYYYAYYNGSELVYDIIGKHRRLTEKPETNQRMLTDVLVREEPVFVAGDHNLGFLENSNGKWYITADFTVPFRTEKAALKYADKYGLTVQDASTDVDECYTVNTGTITVPFADGCAGLDEFIRETDIEVKYYEAVKISKGEISLLHKSQTFEY